MSKERITLVQGKRRLAVVIAHYNYTLRFRSCGLSRGAGRCPDPLMALP
jgi:hypothetical protein